MRLSYLLSLLAALPLAAQAQLLTFGVTGGFPAQIPLDQNDSRVPFVLGPTVTVRLSSRLSFESGLWFTRMGQQFANGVFLYPENSVTLTAGTLRGHALEVPFLGKYYFFTEHHAWRPFITAGPTVRRTSLSSDYAASILSGAASGTIAAQPAFNTNTVQWNVDPAVGAGIDLKTGRFHLEPEVRYSYWQAGVNSAVRKNQVDFLMGFRF